MPFSVNIFETGVKATIEHFAGMVGRASNLMPIWPEIIEIFEHDEDVLFAANGYGWPPYAPTSRPQANMLRKTDRMFHSLTEGTLGDDGDAIRVGTPRNLVFGTGVYYSKFHQGGTKKMPRREVLKISPAANLKARELMKSYIIGRPA